jgi:hypothetical protein
VTRIINVEGALCPECGSLKWYMREPQQEKQGAFSVARWLLAPILMPWRILDRALWSRPKDPGDPRPWYVFVGLTPLLVADHFLRLARFKPADRAPLGQNELECVSCGYRMAF